MKLFKMRLQYFTGAGLEFLKDVLGEQYDTVVNAINAYNQKPENKDKQIKLANVGTGEYVSKEKYSRLEAEKNTLETNLQTAQDTLKGFEGVDVKDLQGKVTTLTNELQTAQTKYQNDIAERDFTDSISKAISAAGGKNSKAIMALLDKDALKASKNQEADIKAAIEACQKDNDYLFGANEPINTPVAPTGGAPIPPGDKLMSSMMSVMGIADEK